MVSRETIDHVVSQAGSLMNGASVRAYADTDAWQVTLGEQTELLVEFVPERDVLMLSAGLGPAARHDMLALYRAMLGAGPQDAPTEDHFWLGMKGQLDALLMLDHGAGGLTTDRVVQLFDSFTERLTWWREQMRLIA